MGRGLWRWLAVLVVVLGAMIAATPSTAQADTYGGTSGTVSWTLDTDTGELHFKPVNGTDGTFASNTSYSSSFWPWHQYASSVTSVTSEGTIHGSQCMSGMFENCKGLTDVSGLASWDTSSVTGMDSMFENCSGLADVSGLASWDTSHVTSMDWMFSGCSGLADVSGLASWDTSHVTSMDWMFRFCRLADLSALAFWDVSSVTSMNEMFYDCSALADLSALASWDTSSVTGMEGMFSKCSKLVDISGLASWDTSSVRYMDSMFSYCYILADVSALAFWDTSHVTSMAGMFQACSNLVDVFDIAGWDTSKVVSVYDMFAGCQRLHTLSMEDWDTSSIGTVKDMFYFCYNLSNVTLGPKVTSSVIQQLPMPSSQSPYTGKWVRTDGNGPYTTSQLANLSPSDRTGTWVWEGTNLSPYVVSFDANGGMGSVASLSPSPFDGTVTIPDGSALVRPGYDFVSWNTRADGTGRSYAPGKARNPIYNEATGRPAIGGESVTLYATWKRQPTEVTTTNGAFDVTCRAGQQVTIQNLPAGASYVVTETPVPSGWILVRSQSTTGVIVSGIR